MQERVGSHRVQPQWKGDKGTSSRVDALQSCVVAI